MATRTRSSQRIATSDMDVVKTSEGRGEKRTFGRDITNSILDPIQTKHVTKQAHVFKAVDNMAVEELPISEAFVKDPREYMQRAADDIDARDALNPLLCTEYVESLYDTFQQQEKEVAVDPDYIAKTQTHVTEKMRSILVDWMVEVHIKYKQVPETLYLTIQLIDRYLQRRSVRRSKLQLVGVACLLLASKYEEIYPPEVRDLVHVTDHAYTKSDIIDAESDVANALEFHLTVPTVHTFLCRYLKAAHADRSMVQMTCYLAERGLQEYSMVGFKPSEVAAACILLARKSLNRQSPWSPTLFKYTGMDECDMQPCMQAMQAFFAQSEGSQQQAVYRKYSATKYGSVAKVPLCF